MRSGMNPNRTLKVDGYKKYISAVIVHLPDFGGYHKERFEVVKACLQSMVKNSELNFQTYVWDNGSCDEVRKWLVDEVKPDYLMLSRNIGKASARASIIKSLPDNVVINISDDDIYYYPGWFEKQVEVLDAFPDVGQVSGCPIRTQARWGNSYTLDWARKRNILKMVRAIPEEYERDFCRGIGRDYAFHKAYTENDYDPVIEYNGHTVIGTAHHCQFIGRVGALKNIVKFDTDAMGDEKPFDIAVDQAKLLRLTTMKRYTRHIGNVMDDDIREAMNG